MKQNAHFKAVAYHLSHCQDSFATQQESAQAILYDEKLCQDEKIVKREPELQHQYE